METGLGLVLPGLLPDPHACAHLPALLATLPTPHMEPLPHIDLTIGCVNTGHGDAEGDKADMQRSGTEGRNGASAGMHRPGCQPFSPRSDPWAHSRA